MWPNPMVGDALRLHLLASHRRAQLEERLLRGAEWEDHDLVFSNDRGRPLDGNNFRQRSFATPLVADSVRQLGRPRV